MKKILGRCLLVLVILGLLGLGLALGISGYVVHSTKDSILIQEDTPPEDLDCILVLGCGIRPDGSPTPMLASRLTRGAELYQAGWADKVLLSGDNSGESYNELATMERVILELGVPPEALLMDHAGFSTYESIHRAKEEFSVQRVVIVTQEYHLYRALYLADALDLEAWGVAAAPRNDAGQIGRSLREILARDKDFFTAIIQPTP
ncbi:MAG: YdcF family protein [Ruminiclostridium sp.]|nr:YdcF family protein [Ruminiclostridium sp.]